MELKATKEYEGISVPQTMKLLTSSAEGLTDSEIQKRTARFGYNETTEKLPNPLLEFLSLYWGPMPWLLELAMLLSYFMGHYLELFIIFALLTINAIISFWHLNTSRKSLELLKTKLAIKAEVLRNGKWVVKPSRELVPGDIISIGLGDFVPADAKIISSREISVDQSVLTGESLPVSLGLSVLIYAGSIIKQGKAECIVLNTGANTYFGRTGELVKLARPVSHQEKIMMQIVKYTMYMGIAALILVIIDAMLVHTTILSILTLALIFLMGAIPVALPTVFAVVLAVGAMELANKGVLVTRLNAIEDAASIEIICLDKTGTITQNKLSIAEIVTLSNLSQNEVAMLAALASQEDSKDPIDLAIIEYAKKNGVFEVEGYRQVSFTPFDPSIKRTEAVIEQGSERFRVIKGAPQVIMALCSKSDDAVRSRANEYIAKLSKLGYRILCVAKSETGNLNDLKLAGLLSLADPPMPDSKAMIEELKSHGIKVKMLTGDNIAIATEIARQVSIGDRIIRREDLKALGKDEQTKILEEHDGVAEIYPEDKYEIVRLLQSRGYIVGMTGDGVNDSPALKQAEVGIAVSNSTDVAKAAASIVLTEPGISVITSAIKTSRQIYQRMLTWVINKIIKVIQFIGLLVLGFLIMQKILLTTLGMVLLVFANDFVTMLLATDNVKDTSNPNIWNVKNITLASLAIALLMIVEGIIAIIVGLYYFRLDFPQLQTFTMLLFVFTSQFRIFVVRERRRFYSSLPGKGLITAGVATLSGFAILGIYGIIVPAVTPHAVIFLIVFSALFTLGLDWPKFYIFKKAGL